MATSWWENAVGAKNYAFRRNLKIVPDGTIYAGYPLFVKFPYTTLLNANKIRPDFQDIEVLYLGANDVWQILPKQITLDGDNILINFNAVADITTTNTKYYVYMTNLNLRNKPTVGTYTSAKYVIDTSVNGYGLTFTNPTEDWLNNESKVVNAKASFSLYGVDARVTVQQGPDHGILELTLDDNDPILIDTYNSTDLNSVIYTTSDLTIGQHYLRFRVTGNKSAYSTGNSIKLVKVEYSKYTECIDLGEEINPTNSSVRITIGS